MALIDVNTQEEFDKNVLQSTEPAVVHFWAAWCDLCPAMDQFCAQLAEKFSNVKFYKVEAEKLSDITEKYGVTAVPAFIFLTKDGAVGSKLEGANPPELARRVEELSKKNVLSDTKGLTEKPSKDLNERLKVLINQAPVMLFMKGSPDAPKCGFSRQAVEILKQHGISFRHFDILSDEDVRQGLKTYSNWPTYPQVYANGKLVGGLDIMKELVEMDNLHDALEIAKQENLDTRLKKLITKAPIMLFMKGIPEQPRCGFSKKIVEILKSNHVEFGSFDILSDEEVRQGLKTYSNWPTYPQLYCNGTLIGGLDIVQELSESGELLDALQ